MFKRYEPLMRCRGEVEGRWSQLPYASRAKDNMCGITSPLHIPSIAMSPRIGSGKVRVPKYLFKLVYDEQKKRCGPSGSKTPTPRKGQRRSATKNWWRGLRSRFCRASMKWWLLRPSTH